MIAHAYIGDPPTGTVGFVGTSSHICNCACVTCLNGGCCMLPEPFRKSVTLAESVAPLMYSCGFATGHAYAIFDATRIYCQKCGEFRPAGA